MWQKASWVSYCLGTMFLGKQACVNGLDCAQCSCACAVNLEPSPEASQRSKEAEIEQAILENVLTTLRDKIKELDQDKWVAWSHAACNPVQMPGPARQLCILLFHTMKSILEKLFCEHRTVQQCALCCSWMFEAPRYTWR